MAVKNTSERVYSSSWEDVCRVLRNPDFSQCINADFLEEAILADGTEFRFVRKTTMTRYGRNYNVKVKKLTESEVSIAVTTQSRKITVLIDPQWKEEVNRVFGFIDMLLRR